MKIESVVLWIFLIFYFSIESTQAVSYRISRATLDRFSISGSISGHRNSDPVDCSAFNAIKDVYQTCDCQCRPMKSTFAFTKSEKQWFCVENKKVRTKLQSNAPEYSKPGEKGNLI